MPERSIDYTLNVHDNITPTANKAIDAEEKLEQSIQNTNAEMDSQNIQFIKNLESLSAFREGITATVGGMKTLGLVSAETGQTLDKVVAGLNIFVGTAQAIKGVVGIYEMLRNAEIGLAAVETYRAVLKNPAMIALAATGLGVAGGVGGYFAAQHFFGGEGGGGGPAVTGGDRQQITQNITFNNGGPSPGSRSATRSSMEAQGDF